MKEKLIEDIEGLKQAAKFMRITNDITPTGLNALNSGLDALIEVVKNISSNPVLADSKNYDHIRVVAIQIYAEYGKDKIRKVVHEHAFSTQELKELMEHNGNVGEYLNHLTKVLRYE